MMNDNNIRSNVELNIKADVGKEVSSNKGKYMISLYSKHGGWTVVDYPKPKLLLILS